MSDSSQRCIYGGETYLKPDNHITHNTASPSKATIWQDQVKSYMAPVNSGGDQITALAYRATSSSESIAERRSQVQQAMHTNLTGLGSSHPSQ